MLVKAAALWVVGLLTLVPYGTYYLFFESSREQYALLITLVLFWMNQVAEATPRGETPPVALA